MNMNRLFRIAVSCILIIFMEFVESQQYRSHGHLRDPWILPKTVGVTSDPDWCNVTVTFNSTGPVSLRWTANGGYSPTDLNKNAIVTDEPSGTLRTAKLSIPFELPLQMLRLHLISAEHAFEIHIDFDVYHGIPNTYIDVKPFTLFVPPSTDIGLTSRGQTQFHIYINASGTPFQFGTLQAEVTSLTSDEHSQVVHDVAYSFLPDVESGKIRLTHRSDTDGVYRADVVLKAPEVYKNGGIISITAACSAPQSIIRRLDAKQELYIKSNPGRVTVANHSVGIIPTPTHDNVIELVESKDTLIRCKAIGNPAPEITLYKQSGTVVEPYSVPSYSSTQAYETMTVYQFINVTRAEEGTYICRASVMDKFKDKEHTIRVLSNTKLSV